MTVDRTELIRQIDDAAERLLRSASRLTDADVRAPSLLPGWTRAHVLTHLARGAEALRNLLVWARTGVETPAYASREARNADIEAGALRSSAELVADLSVTAGVFRAEVDVMPEEAWSLMVGAPGLPDFPAEEVLVRRLVELELHHVDLDIGYGPADWPPTFAELELSEPMHTWREDRRNR